ncbi:hypothetical protein PINS_up019164 [Pythium insidiosum]|nr:hypothetical protein PINS_up019164 [Pythium insidiosum]
MVSTTVASSVASASSALASSSFGSSCRGFRGLLGLLFLFRGLVVTLLSADLLFDHLRDRRLLHDDLDVLLDLIPVVQRAALDERRTRGSQSPSRAPSPRPPPRYRSKER